MFVYEAVYKHNKSSDVFKLWTSKHGTPYITRFKENGDAVLSFEFSNIEERTQAINKAIARGSISLVTTERESESDKSLNSVIKTCEEVSKSGKREKAAERSTDHQL